jgi:protein-disulfide isomerase
MSRKHSWLIALVVAALLVAACGPEMATPTAGVEPVDTSPPATEALAGDAPETQPSTPAEMPVDTDDWHVLGAADAPVTIIEYSDFQ